MNELQAVLKKTTTAQRLLAVLLAAAFLWAYWPMFMAVGYRCFKDPQYSHGFLVPLFAGVLLWHRRTMLEGKRLTWNTWGFALLGLGLALFLLGGYLYVSWFDTPSLLLTLAGLALLLGGIPALQWSWPAIAFLIFMMPLPYRLETALALPLQRVATVTSAYAMQTLGFPAVAENTNIWIRDLPPPGYVEVAPACSGLGMLFSFITLSVAMVLVIDRDWIDKMVILVSAIPIAIVANIVRITLTGALFYFSQDSWAKRIFHDGAGYLMMAVAFAILWLELKIMARLIVPVEARRPLTFGLALTRQLPAGLPKEPLPGRQSLGRIGR
jgi:exosortase